MNNFNLSLLKQENVNLLKDLYEIVVQVPTHIYCYVPEFSESSMGAHVRHILDHYDCFLKGVNSDGNIDYDDRERGEAETCSRSACKNIQSIIDFFDLILNSKSLEGTINLGCRIKEASNITIECRFLFSHTLHHMALIRYLLNA